jgi:dephospho-CoA kinase
MRVIGLTGGIATGKTTVARLLEKLGADIIDADQIAREVVEPGSPVLEKICLLFGHEALLPDGLLNRQFVRNKIFSDPEKRRQLENILHPAIKEHALQQLEKVRNSGVDVAVYVAPLLIEAGATDRVDEIWVVTVRPEVQLQRLMTRDNCSKEEAERVIAAQMPLAEKERFGVVVIDNSASLHNTREQVIAAWRQRIAA